MITNENVEEVFGLTVEQTEILYNIEYYKTLNDIEKTRAIVDSKKTRSLKEEWLREWKDYYSQNFSRFLQMVDVQLHWYPWNQLQAMIGQSNLESPWYRLVLLEAMTFEPYYPLSLETDKNGKQVPNKKYKNLKYDKNEGDRYLSRYLSDPFIMPGHIERFRKCYNKVRNELNEVMKAVLEYVAVSLATLVAAVFLAGVFAPQIAVLLVGSNFAGLHGAALVSACLAYLGGGAIAAGGAGMAGGIATIVGGGALLGGGAGAVVGGGVAKAGLSGKSDVIRQSTKLLVAVREIFLNDEKDITLSNSIYEKYSKNLVQLQTEQMRLKEMEANDTTGDDKKKELKQEIKLLDAEIKAMEKAKESMGKFISSFKIGVANDN